MKITSTFEAILMVCAILAFNTCDDTGGKDKILPISVPVTLGTGGGQIYVIGEIGPSNVGTVFYVTDGGMHGLEAAPSLWDGGSADPTSAWINGTFGHTSIGTTGTAIGTGLSNSNIIIENNQTGVSCAALLCRNYRAGGLSDWFLRKRQILPVIAANE